MVSFGVGTFPAMILIGGLGQFINHHWRKRAVWVAGLFIMLLGFITILRGLFPLTGH